MFLYAVHHHQNPTELNETVCMNTIYNFLEYVPSYLEQSSTVKIYTYLEEVKSVIS